MHYLPTTVLGVFCLLSIIGCSQSDNTLKLLLEPRFLQVDYRNTTEAKVIATLQNQAGQTVPLAGCQFAMDGKDHIWELSAGQASPQTTGGHYSGRYHGRGLQHGECGITLTGFSLYDQFILGCRVRTADGNSWIYETMMFYATGDFGPMQFHLQPSGVTLATAGSDVTFKGFAEHSVKYCRFRLPPYTSVDIDLDEGYSSDKPSVARYHGDGLRHHKQCGITLLDLQPERSGFVTGRVWSLTPEKASADFLEIIVRTAPEAPLLTVNTTGLLAPGHVLHATCVVKNSRPVANLTWILGDEVIREDNINEAPLDSKWRWRYDLQTIEQHLEHVVTLSDNGKRLKCRASHEALASGSQDSTSHVIRVMAADL